MYYKMKCLPGYEPRINVTEEFIKNNNLAINIETAKSVLNEGDIFNKEVAVYFLPFEVLKSYYKEHSVNTEENDEDWRQITDIKEAAQDFLDYMVFAWKKAIDEKGVSASRSIDKLSAWMRILGRTDIAEILDNDDLFYPYGRPALKKACQILGIKHSEYL